MAKPARTRTQACARCQTLSTTLFRVVHEAPKRWVLLCSGCRVKVEGSALYRYGGTWKADKRH